MILYNTQISFTNIVSYLASPKTKSKKGLTKMQKIYGTIRKLGATTNYRGFHFVADAIKLTMVNQDKSTMITKDTYPYIAKKYETTTMNVERCIRVIINSCWKKNKKGMEEIAGYPLTDKPTNSEFVNMVAYYLLELDDE